MSVRQLPERFLERGKSEINEVLPQFLYYSHYVRADLSDEATSDNRTMAYWSAKSERVRELDPGRVGFTAERFKDSARGFNPGNHPH